LKNDWLFSNAAYIVPLINCHYLKRKLTNTTVAVINIIKIQIELTVGQRT